MIYRRLNSTLPIINSFKNEYITKINDKNRIPRAAGGFFACNNQNAFEFLNRCDLIYKLMIKNNVDVPFGDEFITTNAIGMMNNINYFGNNYLCICETGTARNIPDYEVINNCCLLHLPAEKNSGMHKMFKKFIRFNQFPNDSKMLKITHVTRPSLITKIKYIIKIVLRHNL